MAKAKQRQRKPLPAPKPEFEATPERLMHAANDTMLADADIDKAGERAKLTRKFADTHIERMHRRKLITDGQKAAADWYAERYEAAGIEQRLTANLSGMSGGGEASYGMARSNRQYDARKRIRMAREMIPAKMLRFVDDVVLHNLCPCFANQRQRERFAGHIGSALQPLAEWLSLARGA